MKTESFGNVDAKLAEERWNRPKSAQNDTENDEQKTMLLAMLIQRPKTPRMGCADIMHDGENGENVHRPTAVKKRIITFDSANKRRSKRLTEEKLSENGRNADDDNAQRRNEDRENQRSIPIGNRRCSSGRSNGPNIQNEGKQRQKQKDRRKNAKDSTFVPGDHSTRLLSSQPTK